MKLDIKGTEYLLLTLRHPFGGKAGPSHFCLLSDIVVDTINDLLLCKEWDDKTVTSNFIKHIPEAEAYKESAPFKEARKLIVDIPAEDEGKCDGYIDDLITVVVDIGREQERSKAAPCTIIHAIAHLTQNELFVERDDQIAIDKSKAEGAPSEIKICLGWEIDTRRLLMKLPQHKYIAWDTELKDTLSRKSISHKQLESIIGKLEHVITVLKMAGHFMNNLYALLLKIEDSKNIVRSYLGESKRTLPSRENSYRKRAKVSA